jgi:hypothetical protein
MANPVHPGEIVGLDSLGTAALGRKAGIRSPAASGSP